MFDSITREAGSTNVVLGYLLLEAIGNGLYKEETQFDYFNKSCIQGFGNAQHQNKGKFNSVTKQMESGKARWRDLLNKI